MSGFHLLYPLVMRPNEAPLVGGPELLRHPGAETVVCCGCGVGLEPRGPDCPAGGEKVEFTISASQKSY